MECKAVAKSIFTAQCPALARWFRHVRCRGMSEVELKESRLRHIVCGLLVWSTDLIHMH